MSNSERYAVVKRTIGQCGWCLLLITGLLIGSGCNTVGKKNRQADTLANTVLTLLAAQKTDALYEHYTTESFRRANSREKLQKLAKALQLYLGEPKSHTLTRYLIESRGGHSVGEYRYQVEWTKDNGVLILHLEWVNGAWKIRTLDIRSDAIHSGRHDSPATTKPTIMI